MPFDQAVAQGFAELGHDAGWIGLRELPLSALAWVIPAPAGPGNPRVAWYSETRRAASGRLLEGGLHLGRSGGRPFCHAHGIWQDDRGACHAGHLRCDETVLATPCRVTGLALSGARFEVMADPETVFDLFAPVARPDGAAPDAALIRLRPGQDPGAALDALNLPDNATVQGIGSLTGTAFTEAAPISGPAAEFAVTASRRDRDGCWQLSVLAVGTDGSPRRGWLAPGQNQVCVTAELLATGLGPGSRTSSSRRP